MTEKDGPDGHVFLCYAREDSDRVSELHRLLEEAGVPVWRDTVNLLPGEDWRRAIRRAISNDALVFIACFSESSASRGRSFQNEELSLAVGELSRRRPEEPWLIPVRFDDCQIPDWDIGTRGTLASLQRADLFGPQREDEAARLVEVIRLAMARQSASRRTGTPQAESVPADENLGPPARWRSTVEAGRTPTIVGIPVVERVSSTAHTISVVSLLGWLGLALGATYASGQTKWFLVAAVLGSISLFGVSRDEFILMAIWLALPVIILYIYAATRPIPWFWRAIAVMLLIIYIVVLVARVIHRLLVERAESAEADRSRLVPIASAARLSRWLPDTAPIDAPPTVFNDLGEMPAVRFASLRNSRFSYLIVAGTRVALVTFDHWQSGRYTRPPGAAYDIYRNGHLFLPAAEQRSRISQEAARWRRSAPKDVALRFFVVVRPSDVFNNVDLELDDDESGIVFTTLSAFADKAGLFLLEDAYELNIPVLQWVTSRIKRHKSEAL